METTKGVIARKQFDVAMSHFGDILKADPNDIRTRQLLAEFLVRAGKDAQAAAIFGRLYEETGAADHIARNYVAALARSSQHTQAVKVLTSLPSEGGDDVQVRQLLLEMLKKEGRLSEAAAKLTEWLDKSGDRNFQNWCRAQLLEVYEQSRSFDQALKANEQWLGGKLDDDVKAGLKLTRLRLLGQSGRYSEAVDYARRLLDGADDGTGIKVQIVAVLAEVKQYDRALELLDEWLAEEGGKKYGPLAEAKLVLLIQSNRMAQARSFADEWLLEQPTALQPRQLLVSSLVDLGEKKEAEAMVDRWLAELQSSRRPSRAATSSATTRRNARKASGATNRPFGSSCPMTATSRHATTCVTLTTRPSPGVFPATSRAVTASTALRRASGPTPDMAAMSPSDPRKAIRWCREMSVHLLLMQSPFEGKYEQAMERVQKYLAADPDDAQELSLQSTIFSELGRDSEAVTALEKALALNKNDPGLLNNLGYLYADRGMRVEQAEQMIRQAIAARGEEPAFMDSLGWVLYKQGRFSEAAAVFDRLLSPGRPLPDGAALMFFHAGDAYYRLGWTNEALQRWARAVEMARQEKVPTAETRMILEQAQEMIQAAAVGQVPRLAPAESGKPNDEARTTMPAGK
jgi:tetratricopeptide (TPR) repeat protein